MATDRRRTVWTMAITSIALFMGALDNLVVTTACPSCGSSCGRPSRASNGR